MSEKHPLTDFRFCPKCGSSKFDINNVKSKRCGACDFVYYINPSAAVAVFVVNKKEELLVCRRAHEPAKGTFDLPGGFVDLGENVEEALVRELLEETGVAVTDSRYLFSLPNSYRYSEFDVPTMDLFFLVEVENELSLQANDDVEWCQFIAFESLKSEQFGLASVSKAVALFLNKAYKM